MVKHLCNKVLRTTFKAIPQIFYIIIFIVFTSFISFCLIVIFRLSERYTMHLAFILGMLFSTTLLYIVFRRAPKIILKLIIIDIIFLLFSEITIIYLSPLHSALSESVLIKLHIIKYVDQKSELGCDDLGEITKAKNFMKNDIEFTPVKFVYLGDNMIFQWLWHFGPEIAASTLGNYVYIIQSKNCYPVSIYVHELAHVWQYQQGQGFGIKWIPFWISNYWKIFTDINSLYDLGGSVGLFNACKNNKPFETFTIEQQAKLVEYYYLSLQYKSIYENWNKSYEVLNCIVSKTFHFK